MNRVKIDNFGKPPYFGEFLGLVSASTLGCDRCEGSQDSAVVRPDNFGLYVMFVHPSRIMFVTAEQEEAYK